MNSLKAFFPIIYFVSINPQDHLPIFLYWQDFLFLFSCNFNSLVLLLLPALNNFLAIFMYSFSSDAIHSPYLRPQGACT